MSTEKNITLQKNKNLTYCINKEGFKTSLGTVNVQNNQTVNVSLIENSSETEQFTVGDRLFNCSSFFAYFTPSGDLDINSLKFITASQTTGNNLFNIEVVKSTWLNKVETELGIVLSKGNTSKFIFTFNGSQWNLSGAVSISNVNLEDFGISFEGNALTGNIITVIFYHFNKFACFVLDANFRGSSTTGAGYETDIMIKGYDWKSMYWEVQPCLESATFFMEWTLHNKNLNNLLCFNYAKNIGEFILPNGIKINAVVPNTIELPLIYSKRSEIDAIDPVVIADPTNTYRLNNWVNAWSCVEYNNSNGFFILSNSTHTWEIGATSSGYRMLPIFEVPIF